MVVVVINYSVLIDVIVSTVISVVLSCVGTEMHAGFGKVTSSTMKVHYSHKV